MGKDWNKKIDEKDYVRLAIIVGILVLTYFIYVNFIPKSFDNTLKVDIIEISVDCVDCVDLSVVRTSLVEMGIEIKNYDVYTYDSDKGKKFIKKYGIEKVPTSIIISRQIDEMGLEGAFDIKDNYAVFGMNAPYIDIASEELRGVVDMIEIGPECTECLSLMPLKTQFEKMGIKVGSYEIIGAESTRGLEMISEFNLDFAPTLLISKDIEEYGWVMPNIDGVLEDKGDYYLFKSAIAPYKDLDEGLIRGLVEITLINDSNCKECFDVNELKQSFQSMGVYINSEKILDISSYEGKKLIKRYNITSVPTIVLSKEILDYPQLRDVLGQVGTFNENDQSFIFRKLESVGEFVEVDL